MKRFVAEFAVQHGLSARDKRMKKHQVNQKHTHTNSLVCIFINLFGDCESFSYWHRHNCGENKGETENIIEVNIKHYKSW